MPQNERPTWADFSFQQRYLVHWGDMDAARHVNNLTYLRWAESARIAFFEKYFGSVSFQGSIGPILAWQDCKYIFPMTFPDHVLVGVKVSSLEADRFTLETHLFSEKHERIAAINLQRIVPYDYGKLQKAPLPDQWKTQLEKMC